MWRLAGLLKLDAHFKGSWEGTNGFSGKNKRQISGVRVIE